MYVVGATGFRQICLPACDAALTFVVFLILRPLYFTGTADRGASSSYLELMTLIACVVAVNFYTGLYQRRFFCRRVEFARTVLSAAMVIIALQVGEVLGFYQDWPAGLGALTVLAVYGGIAFARLWVRPDGLGVDRSRGVLEGGTTATGGEVGPISGRSADALTLKHPVSAQVQAFFRGLTNSLGRPTTVPSREQAPHSEPRSGIAPRSKRIPASAALFELETGRIVPGNSPSLVELAGAQRKALHPLLKRALDIAAGIAILVLSLPITIAVALAIHLTDRGPIFYRQRRIGLSGREFTILKFRSMRVDAEADGKARWAAVGDPRVTAIGRYLRRSRIDEIPQVLNILRGDMSIVGPRPERPEIVRSMEAEIPLYDLRHTVKPGLTGWAQINFPYGASLDDTIQKTSYDLYYVKNETILLDFIILIATIQVVLRGEGAR